MRTALSKVSLRPGLLRKLIAPAFITAVARRRISMALIKMIGMGRFVSSNRLCNSRPLIPGGVHRESLGEDVIANRTLMQLDFRISSGWS